MAVLTATLTVLSPPLAWARDPGGAQSESAQSKMLSGIGGFVLGLLFLGVGLFIHFRNQKGEDPVSSWDSPQTFGRRNIALLKLVLCTPVALYKACLHLVDLKFPGNPEIDSPWLLC
ncbi:hypothetical protein HPG69_018123 [Diceros bicornis minor]|uniref:Uncharacterized protein n=1 Tax=Diceros bicornis minor TaxID=77932 RepID=A0A7J7EJ63_DICBM|nr:hypothetical protein HPG69_018123 [Diceros bicornis minor]